MESHSKVMTVSYGTFSCTLEGFDDPFTTMQLVAEYFRKLAQQDRYFGGEPLQPDHNALHEIAKQANPYKVDAEVTDTGITLRKANIVDAAQKNSEPEPELEIAPTPVTDKQADETPEMSEPGFFTSRRVKQASAKDDQTPDTEENSSEVTVAPPETEITQETAAFVEAAIFSSRRGPFEEAETESERTASALIEDEDADPEEDFSQAVSANLETMIDAQIAEDTDDQPDEPVLLQEETPASSETHQSAKAKDTILREEAALERLLETTNSKLDNPAHARRSNALERLKAAVAATEAERRLNTDKPRTERPKVQNLQVDPAQFREKISEVRHQHEDAVKFSRPKSKAGSTRTRGTIATLILGNEQRIVSDAGEAAVPAKKFEDKSQTQSTNQDSNRPPLKIVRGSDIGDETAAKSNFEEFARKIGANTLHELLEASAAYLSIVEEQPRFSQNRIIENLNAYLSENGISEDATSRSLNRLMRDGRILRVKQDSYTISKSARHGFQEKMVS